MKILRPNRRFYPQPKPGKSTYRLCKVAQFRNEDRIKIDAETVQPSANRTNQITSETGLHRKAHAAALPAANGKLPAGTHMRFFLLSILAALAVTASAQQPAQNPDNKPKPEETELWKPVPAVVTPGATYGAPPSDAIILFNGKNADEWVKVKDQTPVTWTVQKGILTVVKDGTGNIETRRRFKNYQLHIEWRIPSNITGSGQARGNSGVFLASTGPGDDGYELQVLDAYQNETYVNGMAGSLYKQAIPLANAARKPGQWQTYDVVWTAPVFNDDGSLKTPAYATVLWNGVLVEDHFELKGQTLYIGKPFYKKYDTAPIKLQAHGDKSEPISFRNIWVRELP